MLQQKIKQSSALLACFLSLISVCQSVSAAEVRPEINGTLDAACRTTNTCVFMGKGSNATGAVPTDVYGALVKNAKESSYITIKDLSVQDSAGMSVLINVRSHHIIVENLEVGYSAMQPLDIKPFTNQVLVRNSAFHHSSICSFWHRGNKVVDDPAAPDSCEKNHPATVELGGLSHFQPATNIVFVNNDVYTGFGEGIGMFGTDTVWVVGNRVRNHRTAEVLNDNSYRTIVEGNICWDFDNSSDRSMGHGFNGPHEKPEWGAACYKLTLEPLGFGQDTTDNIFRNNICAGAPNCLTQNNAANINNVQQADFGAGAKWYSNTNIAYRGYGANFASGKNVDDLNRELQVVNNIFYSPDFSRFECQAHSGVHFEKFSMGPNWFGAGSPSDSDCHSKNSAFPDKYGKPRLSRDVDTWDESNWTVSRGPTHADATPVSGAVLNAGRPLEERVSFLDDIDWQYFGEVEYPCENGLTGFLWEKENAYDATCSRRSTSRPDLGAIEAD